LVGGQKYLHEHKKYQLQPKITKHYVDISREMGIVVLLI
jgi:hypothetical protein